MTQQNNIAMAKWCLENAFAARSQQIAWIWAGKTISNAALAGIELDAGPGRWPHLELMRKQLFADGLDVQP